MATIRKLLASILSGRADANIRFNELRRLLKVLSFDERITGGHHIFARVDVLEIVNIQPLRGGKAKPYQVKQIRQLIVKYGLQLKLSDP